MLLIMLMTTKVGLQGIFWEAFTKKRHNKVVVSESWRDACQVCFSDQLTVASIQPQGLLLVAVEMPHIL